MSDTTDMTNVTDTVNVTDIIYHSFINEAANTDFLPVTLELDSERMVVVKNVMSDDASRQVLSDIDDYKYQWWVTAIYPGPEANVIHFSYGGEGEDGRDENKEVEEEIEKHVVRAKQLADNGYFSYVFKRTEKNHYDTCYCFSCRLNATFEGEEIKEFLSKVTGHKVKEIQETFASMYTKGDFLTIHHDKNKGDYTFVLMLTPDWHPCYGGLTHFYDESTKSIYKTLIPVFNNMLVFKLTDDGKSTDDTFTRTGKMDHYVSTVTGPIPRIAYTGWFTVEKE